MTRQDICIAKMTVGSRKIFYNLIFNRKGAIPLS